MTLHMRGRKFPSRRAHAEVSRLLAALADVGRGRRKDWIVTAEVRCLRLHTEAAVLLYTTPKKHTGVDRSKMRETSCTFRTSSHVGLSFHMEITKDPPGPQSV